MNKERRVVIDLDNGYDVIIECFSLDDAEQVIKDCKKELRLRWGTKDN